MNPTASSGAPARLFAYGTLTFPEVFRRVCGFAFPAAAPATLQGYACLRVAGASYPGIAPRAGAMTVGLLFEGLDAAAWSRLDAFETDFYQRDVVTVVLEDGHERAACAYVVRTGHRHALSAEIWSREQFADRHLAHYLACDA